MASAHTQLVSITKLRLQNFQAHKDTTLEFSSNFNCIVGPTRSGKSCVIRAFDFLFYNEWYSEYQAFDSDQTVVTASLSTGATVIRTKSEKVNRIEFILPDGTKPPPIEGFGHTLPREYCDALGIIPIEVDADTSINANVANQDDRLFLLYNDGSASVTAVRTKVLSRLSGLHWIDYALKDLSKDRRDNTQEIQKSLETKKSLDEQIKNLPDLTGLDSALILARERLTKLKQVASTTQKLETLIQRASRWKENHKKLQEIKTSSVQVSRFEQAVSLYESSYQKLKDLIHRLDSNELSSHNISSHIESIVSQRTELQHQLEDELTRQPLCPTCGSLVDPVKFQATV